MSTIEKPQSASSSSLGARVQSLRLPDRRGGATSYAWAACYIAVAVALYLGYRQWFVVPGQIAEIRRQAEQLAATAPKADSRGARSTLNSSASGVTRQAGPIGEVALEAKGYIIPAHQILVSPKVSGMVVTLNLEEGMRVQEGDILAVLEKIEYQADFDRAQANVALAQQRLNELENGNRPEEIAQAEAELNESQSMLNKAEADWKRAQDLRTQNVIPPQDYDLAKSSFLSAQSRLEKLKNMAMLMRLGARLERREQARAELQQAQAELAKAEWRLGNCTIRAPISGTILKKNAEEGNIVNPIAFNGSFSLCEMADLSDLEVELNIQERDISRVKQGQNCRVRAEAYPERVYTGVVDRLMPIADRAKGAVPVRVKLTIPQDEEGVYLKPEMGAIVTFLNTAVSESKPGDKAKETTATTILPDIEKSKVTPIKVVRPDQKS